MSTVEIQKQETMSHRLLASDAAVLSGFQATKPLQKYEFTQCGNIPHILNPTSLFLTDESVRNVINGFSASLVCPLQNLNSMEKNRSS